MQDVCNSRGEEDSSVYRHTHLTVGHLQHTDSVNSSRRVERITITIMHAQSYQTTHQLAQLYTVEREKWEEGLGGGVSMATFPPCKKNHLVGKTFHSVQ